MTLSFLKAVVCLLEVKRRGFEITEGVASEGAVESFDLSVI
jgi:hypothetical protein